MKRAPLLVVLLAAASANAGGLERPNQISARGVGMGGAFAGIADDGSAWYYNPAGAAWAEDAIMIGGEFVYAPRTYKPIDATGTKGAAQSASAASPVPSLGIVLHPSSDGVPSRLAFGAGIYNNFGGAITFPKMANASLSEVNSSTDLVIELGAGVAYEVDDVLAIGGTVRMGLGQFAVDANAHPADTNVSAIGVGVGGTIGVMLRPTQKLQLGVTWRSGMSIATQGSGTATLTSPMQSVDAKHTQTWPQQVAIGASVWAAPSLRLSGELDWTQWSKYRDLTVELLQGGSDISQSFPLDWNDSYAVRGGLEYLLGGSGAVRAGAYYDTNAVPNRTIEREYLDSNKIGVSAGGSGIFGAWRIDGAVDFTLPGTRNVPDNSADYTFGSSKWNFANVAPGDYYGYVVTVELAVVRRL